MEKIEDEGPGTGQANGDAHQKEEHASIKHRPAYSRRLVELIWSKKVEAALVAFILLLLEPILYQFSAARYYPYAVAAALTVAVWYFAYKIVHLTPPPNPPNSSQAVENSPPQPIPPATSQTSSPTTDSSPTTKEDDDSAVVASREEKRRFTIRRRKAVLIMLGGNITGMDSSRPEGMLWVSQFIPTLSFHLVNKEFVWNAEFTDGRDKATMTDNELIEHPDDWDLNEDNHCVEIVNGKLHPVFQMFFTDDPAAFIMGGFWIADQRASYISADGAFHGNEDIGLAANCNLTRIFKYPSSDFLGKREKPISKNAENRTLTEYAKQICGVHDINEWSARCAQNSSYNFNPRFTAEAAWNWIMGVP